MATEEKVNHITALAGADLSAALYKFGTWDSTGRIVVAGTAQGPVAGVIDENVALGANFPLAQPDGCKKKVMAGAAIAALGTRLATDASGRAIAWVNAAGNVDLGVNLEVAAAAGEIITIHFLHGRTG